MDTRTATAAAAGALAGAGAVIAAAAGWVWLACRAAAEDEHGPRSWTRRRQPRWESIGHLDDTDDTVPALLSPGGLIEPDEHGRFPTNGPIRWLYCTQCRGCPTEVPEQQRCYWHRDVAAPVAHDEDCEDPWCEYGLPGWLTGPERQLCDRHRDGR